MALVLYIYLSHRPDELNKNSDFLKEFTKRLNQYTGNNKSLSSIEMRISNYKSIDNKYPGKGLTNGGKNVKVIWDKYRNRIDLLEQKYDSFVMKTKIDISQDDLNKELKLIDAIYSNDNYDDIDAYIETMLALRNGKIQQKFRKDLLMEFNEKCSLCKINQNRFLISSHIYPYSKCKNAKDMVNHYNGLLLCANHDALFDKKIISFDDNGKIIISKSLPVELYNDFNINEDMILESKYLTPERRKYLQKHRELMAKEEN